MFGIVKRPAQPKQSEPLQRRSLEDLFALAENYGRVLVFSSDDRPRSESYRVTIEFASIAGTTLNAKSDFDLRLADALEMAIDRAEQIRAQFK